MCWPGQGLSCQCLHLLLLLLFAFHLFALLLLRASHHIVTPALLSCSTPSDSCLSLAPLGTAGPIGSTTGNPARYFLLPKLTPKSPLTYERRKTGLHPSPCKKKHMRSTPGLDKLILGRAGRRQLCQRESVWYGCLKVRTAGFCVFISVTSL